MDYKKSATILISLLKKPSLNPEEKEAVEAAIGVLSWTALSQSKMKILKAKRDKDTK